ncbi:MAG TPA: hypothetical protein PLU17_08135 [Chitinophagaceae bacterium]|jgi:hypothetical protein|nr:hypothetical protein [Chitinophagaceae bacterium]
MLEIIALIFLTRKIGDLAITKGLKPGTWKLYTVLAWFTGEILGIMIGFAIFGQEKMIMAVLVGIPCAIGGYHIVKSTLDKKPDIYNEDINQIGDNLVQ